MNAQNIALQLAKDIFEAGNNQDSHCHRIQFLGGSYPDNETPQGGMCEQSLACFISKSLSDQVSWRIQQSKINSLQKDADMYSNAERQWEISMAKATGGHDGVGSVSEYIESLKDQINIGSNGMKGLTVKFENGKIGSVTSDAHMHDDGEFYCVVLCEGEFKKTNIGDIKNQIVQNSDIEKE